jgi:hypothetical protein
VTYGVPGGHVLLHTVGHAGRLAAGEAGAGLGDTLLVAVGVDFLGFSQLLLSNVIFAAFRYFSPSLSCSLILGAPDTSAGFP